MEAFLAFWRIFFVKLPEFLPYLLKGATVTLQITFATLAVSFIIGLALALVQRVRIARGIVAAYVEVARSAPVITTLFIIYFGLSYTGIRLSSFVAAVIALSALGAAYMSEILRAGIESVDRGQREAALSIGMTPRQSMRYIILPQALRVVVPPTTNYVIGLLKDTAVVSTVAAPELLFAARTLVSETILPMQIYLLTAAIYLVMSLTLATVARRIEHRLMRSI
jgi:polar amino acid transport system permease protein/cystine transport system permease protein